MMTAETMSLNSSSTSSGDPLQPTASWRDRRNQILQALLFAFFLIFLTLHFADPIRLVTADLGRHLKNGELILAGERGLLTRNFYSYTQPDFPFINHHWGIGVVLYSIYAHAGGFPGLSVFYIAILVLTFVVFFRLAERLSSFPLAFFFSVVALPIFTDRLEIRPEGVSVLWIGLYLYLLFQFLDRRISAKVLFWIIPLLQVIWVNVHVFFFMGGFLIVVFFMDAWLVQQDKGMMRQLAMLAGLTAAASLINPAGLAGALVPLNIFKQYGYELAENQSVFFMQKRFGHDVKYVYFQAMLILAVASMVAAWWKKSWRTYLTPFLILVFFGVLGLKTVRSMAMFGFVFIPLAALWWHDILARLNHGVRRVVAGGLLAVALVVVVSGVIDVKSYFSPYRRLGVFVSPDPGVQRTRGFFYLLAHPELWTGLVPGTNDAASFFKRLNIQGPVFNNYDIGGYLIFHLFGRTPVFVDNRPEAYTVSFFRSTYVPMQDNDEAWTKADQQYHFNSIFFYRHDLTPWGQAFLIHRIRDPQWAPVFVDAFNIVFLRRNPLNAPIIKAFELPREMFKVTASE